MSKVKTKLEKWRPEYHRELRFNGQAKPIVWPRKYQFRAMFRDSVLQKPSATWSGWIRRQQATNDGAWNILEIESTSVHEVNPETELATIARGPENPKWDSLPWLKRYRTLLLFNATRVLTHLRWWIQEPSLRRYLGDPRTQNGIVYLG